MPRESSSQIPDAGALVLPTNLCQAAGGGNNPEGGPTIGVLALQGGYHEHEVMLSRAGARCVEVRQARDLTETALDGLVIPGGESTTMGHLANRLGLLDPLRRLIKAGMPVMGTCAGLIFLADEVRSISPEPGSIIPIRTHYAQVVGQKEGGQANLGGMDVTVARNFFGAQIDSFETELKVSLAPDDPKAQRVVSAIFIRAPAVIRSGPAVRVLASLDGPSIGRDEPAPVAVQQGSLIGLSFHPELTTDLCWHAHFVELCREKKAPAAAPTEKAAPPKGSKRQRRGGK